MAKKRRVATDASTALENNALAGLAGLMSAVPDAEAPATEPEPEAEPGRGDDAMFVGKLVVRREKKGRGGKGVTVIEGLVAEVAELEAMARQMKKDLGCGAHVEGPRVVLQGTQSQRARAWLLEHGAKTVVVGN